MLIQLLSDDTKESVLEFSARTGGGAKYLLLKKASGFDPISAVIDLTLGEKPIVGEIQSESKYIINEFLYCYPGIFDRLDGFEQLKMEGVISEYWQFKWQGAKIITANTSSDRVASITIQADTFEEIVSKHNRAASRIKVLNSEGKDILRHDLLTDIEKL